MVDIQSAFNSAVKLDRVEEFNGSLMAEIESKNENKFDGDFEEKVLKLFEITEELKPKEAVRRSLTVAKFMEEHTRDELVQDIGGPSSQ